LSLATTDTIPVPRPRPSKLTISNTNTNISARFGIGEQDGVVGCKSVLRQIAHNAKEQDPTAHVRIKTSPTIPLTGISHNEHTHKINSNSNNNEPPAYMQLGAAFINGIPRAQTVGIFVGGVPVSTTVGLYQYKFAEEEEEDGVDMFDLDDMEEIITDTVDDNNNHR
jgi:hypothetical protein